MEIETKGIGDGREGKIETPPTPSDYEFLEKKPGLIVANRTHWKARFCNHWPT